MASCGLHHKNGCLRNAKLQKQQAEAKIKELYRTFGGQGTLQLPARWQQLSHILHLTLASALVSHMVSYCYGLTFGGSLVIFTPFCRMLTGNLGEG